MPNKRKRGIMYVEIKNGKEKMEMEKEEEKEKLRRTNGYGVSP